MARKVELHPSCHTSVYASNVRDHTRQVFEYFAEKFAVHYGWGNGPTGDHAAGKAIDLMAYSRGNFTLNGHGPIRKGWNAKVAHEAWELREEFGVAYIIYDQMIISTNPDSSAGAFNQWVDYNGESHANHVHVSLVDDPPPFTHPEDDVSAKDVWTYPLTIDQERHADLGYKHDSYKAGSLVVDASHRSRRSIKVTRDLTDLVRKLAANQTDEIREEINAAADRIIAETELDDVDEQDE